MTLGHFAAGEVVGGEIIVSIRDNFFSPNNVTLAPGDSVKWMNDGSMVHTTTSNSGLWDSGVLAHGASFSRTFNDLGSFPYHCTVHGLSMSGTITVTAGGVPPHDLFLVTFSGTSRTTNALGGSVVVSLKTKDLIEDCAEENSRDPLSLNLVYDLQDDAIRAVNRTNGVAVCTVATFSGGVTVRTADGKRRDRQAFVYWEDDMEASGSMVGTENVTRGMSGELTKYSFRGSLQVGFESYNGEPPKVFQGTFSIGRRFVPKP
jgi:plastocyanin